MNLVKVFDFLYRSPLPTKKIVKSITGLTQVIDLTIRDRKIKLYCEQLNVKYYKMPLNEHELNINRINQILELITPDQITLVHCWGGRHRTGLIVGLIQYKYNIAPRIILNDLFNNGFGDPLQYPDYFNYLLDQIYANQMSSTNR